MTPKGQRQKRNRIAGVSKRTTTHGETRWRAVVDIGEGIERKQISQTFPTQAEAESWRIELLARRRRGDVVAPSQMRLSEWFEEWIETRAVRVRPASAYNYRVTMRRVLPLLGSLPLARITPSAIERAYGALEAEYGPTTMRGVHRVFKMVLETAVRDGLLPRNPALRVDPPGKPAEPRAVWTLDQARAFMAGLGAGHYDDVWRLILETWMRSGEVRALRWSDVDLDRASITIARTVTVAAHGGSGFGPPKSATSGRMIPLSAAAVARLRDRKHAAKVDAMELGEGWSDERLVFTAQSGGMMHPSKMNTALRQTCARIGVPHISVHGLRHAGGSIAHAAGVPLAVISRQLGHASLAITLAVYVHADDDQRAGVAETMAKLLTG